MEFYKVGKIINTHGIKGEVRVIVTSDFADERFAKDARLFLEQPGSEPLELKVAAARPHKGALLVKFAGYDNINDVQAFRGHELLVAAEDQQPLAEGEYYYHQIIGLRVVTTDGRELGKIKEIMAPGANDVWVVQRPGQADLLLPKIDDVIKDVDLDNQVVTVELMEGLE